MTADIVDPITRCITLVVFFLTMFGAWFVWQRHLTIRARFTGYVCNECGKNIDDEVIDETPKVVDAEVEKEI